MLSKEQIEAIELLTGYKFKSQCKKNTKFINKYGLLLSIYSDSILMWEDSYEDYSQKLPSKWLLPLHQIINETKTTPVYKSYCDDYNCVAWNRHTEPSDCHRCGGKDYDCPLTHSDNECLNKELVGFE